MYKKYLRTEKIESWFLMFVLSLIWGSSYILIKKGLKAFSPDQVGTLRITFAFLFMLPFAVKHLKNIPKGKWKIIFFTGMIGNLIPAILFAMAETNLASSLTGILNALSPVFTLIIAVYIFNYEINWKQIAGLIICFAGTIGLSLINSSGGIGEINVYVWLVVLATICYALSLNFIKAYLSDVNSIIVTSLAMLSIGPLSLVYLLSTDFFDRVAAEPDAVESLICIAVLGIFGTAIGLALYTRLIQMTSPMFASSVTYLIPVVAIFWGLLDNENLYLLHLAGIALIMIGIYIVNRFEPFRKDVTD